MHIDVTIKNPESGESLDISVDDCPLTASQIRDFIVSVTEVARSGILFVEREFDEVTGYVPAIRQEIRKREFDGDEIFY